MWKRGKREWNIELFSSVCVCYKEQCHGNRSLWSRTEVGGTLLKLCVRDRVVVDSIEIMSGGPPVERCNKLLVIKTQSQWITAPK